VERESRAQVQEKIDPKKMEQIWMRNTQTTPADFLGRRFAAQAAQEHHK
jgi:Ca-activated chloride channel family protein